MNKLIICVGIPCSGKSTWSREYLQKNENTIRINRDELRLMMKGSLDVHYTIEGMLNNVTNSIINISHACNKDVIADNTHCKLSYINCLLDNRFDIHFRIFSVSLEEAKRRNFVRYKATGIEIPEDVIENFYQRFNSMINGPDFKKLTTKYNTEWIG